MSKLKIMLDKFIDFMQTEHNCKKFSKAGKIGCSSLLTILLAAGCATSGKPRYRTGSLPTPSLGSTFASQEEANPLTLYNRGAIIYTSRGGHIDLDHLRYTADWTIYLAQQTQEHLMKNKTDFSFKLHEPSQYFVHINYPDSWKNLSQEKKENIAHEISIALGQDFAFKAAIWHEIITWFGYKSTLIPSSFPSSLEDLTSSLPRLCYRSTLVLSEFPSAFSWEDPYSNLLGSCIGAQAIQDTKHLSDEAINLVLDRELKTLGVQSKSVTKKASEKVKGNWYSLHLLFFPSMDKRNFDIGLDGFVTPWLVPSISGSEQPQPYPVPNLDCLSKYGFSVKLEIEPREFEKHKILNIIYSDRRNTRDKRNTRIQPSSHFPLIMKYIKQQAVEKYGPNVDKPYIK